MIYILYIYINININIYEYIVLCVVYFVHAL